MNHIGLVVLYVEDLAKSKAFYEQLFDLEADIPMMNGNKKAYHLSKHQSKNVMAIPSLPMI